MKAKLIGAITSIALILPPVAVGQRVAVTSDIAGNAIERSFEVGDVVPVTFSVNSDGEPAILGVRFQLCCRDDALSIHSISFNPAFSVVLGDAEPVLPASCFRTVRVQPADDVDRTLGANGDPVAFATVELEVLEATDFRSALDVQARCALVGAVPAVTTVLGVESSGRGRARGKVDVANRRPTPSWTEQQAPLTFEVQPVGGGAAVTVLAPNTTYELHYQAGYGHLNCYLLMAVTTSSDQGLSGAAPPAGGGWSPPEDFGFSDVEAELGHLLEWGPEGDFLTHMVYDLWQGTNRHAGPRDHLCNFTTQSAGELTLDLFMYWYDRTEHHCVWMRSEAEFLVQ